MSFTGYLKFDEVQELVQAAIDGNLFLKSRILMFQDIRPAFVANFHSDPAPGTQFQLDLNRLNMTERLEDNTVPLLLYLRNAAALMKDVPEGKVFERYRSLVENRSKGLHHFPAPSSIPEIVSKEAIIYQDDMVDLSFVMGALNAAKSVARIKVPRFDNGVQRKINSTPYVFQGSGWLISPSLLITNHHVINARLDQEGMAAQSDLERQALESTVSFDYDDDQSAVVDCGIEAFELANVDLDYCLLRLKTPPVRAALKLEPTKVQINATSYLPVNVIQHPGGKAKKLAIRNNLAAAADDDTVRYYTDTDQGSSGAPVLNDRWRVIALHRGALFVDEAKFQGKDTAYVNFGSQITRILRDIETRKPALSAEINS